MFRFSGFLWLMYIGVAFGVLADSQESESAEKIAIGVGGFGASSYQPVPVDWFDQEAALFEARHPNIDVRTIGIERPNRKVMLIEEWTSLASDVIGLSSWAGNETYYLAEGEYIIPLDEFIDDPEFDEFSIDPSLWLSAKHAGKTWGIPWACESYALLVNTPIFEAEGIDHVPTTWNELDALARRLTKDLNGDGQIDQWGIGFNGTTTAFYSTLCMADQFSESREKGEDFEFSLDGFVATAEWTRFQMESAHLGYKDLDRCAMLVLPASKVRGAQEHYPRATQDFRLEPLPIVREDVPKLAWDILYFAIRKSTPERERAAWEFVKWMMRPDCSVVKTTGEGVSPLLSMLAMPCHQNFMKREDMRQQAAESFPGIEIMWESRQEFYPMFRGNVRGGGMALRQIRLSLEDDFKQGISPEESFAKSIPRANASLETLTRRPTTLQMLYE